MMLWFSDHENAENYHVGSASNGVSRDAETHVHPKSQTDQRTDRLAYRK